MWPLISVIVPVYKVEDVLARCLDSLCRQSLQNIEIILIDDASPDRCGTIAKHMQKKIPGSGSFIIRKTGDFLLPAILVFYMLPLIILCLWIAMTGSMKISVSYLTSVRCGIRWIW